MITAILIITNIFTLIIAWVLYCERETLRDRGNMKAAIHKAAFPEGPIHGVLRLGATDRAMRLMQMLEEVPVGEHMMARILFRDPIAHYELPLQQAVAGEVLGQPQ